MSLKYSLEKFIKNAISTKILGKTFKSVKYSSSVNFCEDGPFLIQSIDFSFTSIGDSSNYECMTDYSTPSYELAISGMNTETNEKFYYSNFNINDLP